MRRGWVAMVLVVAMACGIALPSGACAKCHADTARSLNATHSCCGTAARVSTRCCDGVHESGAVAAAGQREVAAQAAICARTGIAAVCAVCENAAAFVSASPGLRPPPVVLRT